MSALSGLSAEQLAEKVRPRCVYDNDACHYEAVLDDEGLKAKAELVRRASERDQPEGHWAAMAVRERERRRAAGVRADRLAAETEELRERAVTLMVRAGWKQDDAYRALAADQEPA